MSERADDGEELAQFWAVAKVRAKTNPVPGYLGVTASESVVPPAWSFGADGDHADELLALVLSGAKTATASARWDYDVEGAALPQVGDLSIVLDGAGHPRALIRTTAVDVVPFADVDAEHARLEGEGTLADWRTAHERFFTEHARGFSTDMPVVLERFTVLYS